MSRQDAAYWIDLLHLQEHEEGGWYRQLYRSDLLFGQLQLPAAFTGDRYACTHIYFLLSKENFSAFHRIRSDELWHFYSGDALVIYEIDQEGRLIEHLLGADPQAGQSFFTVIRAGSWFASRIADGGEYGLVGCTVAPGFDYEDFELADGQKLSAEFPQHASLIRQLCR